MEKLKQSYKDPANRIHPWMSDEIQKQVKGLNEEQNRGNRRTTHMGDGIDMNDKKGKSQRDRAQKLNAMNTAENAQIEEMFDSTHPGDAKKANLDPGAGISN